MADKVRKTVSFPEELEIQISRRAKKFDRSFSAQVVADMRLIIERAEFHNALYNNERDQKSGQESGRESGDGVEK